MQIAPAVISGASALNRWKDSAESHVRTGSKLFVPIRIRGGVLKYIMFVPAGIVLEAVRTRKSLQGLREMLAPYMSRAVRARKIVGRSTRNAIFVFVARGTIP